MSHCKVYRLGGIIAAIFANHLPQSILTYRIEVGRELEAQLT